MIQHWRDLGLGRKSCPNVPARAPWLILTDRCVTRLLTPAHISHREWWPHLTIVTPHACTLQLPPTITTFIPFLLSNFTSILPLSTWSLQLRYFLALATSPLPSGIVYNFGNFYPQGPQHLQNSKQQPAILQCFTLALSFYYSKIVFWTYCTLLVLLRHQLDSTLAYLGFQ